MIAVCGRGLRTSPAFIPGGTVLFFTSDSLSSFANGVLSLNRFQRAALLTTFTTYLLIGVGGLVRASGAGLGCPDWPLCFGLIVPPLSASDLPIEFDVAQFNVFKTWTEYLNRLLGVVTGFLIFITLAFALMDHRQNRRVLWSSVASFICVIFNGWLGGMVVRSQLAPYLLTGHLTFAMVLVGCLLYATVSAFFPSTPSSSDQPATYPDLVWVTGGTSVVLLLQVALGALVRGKVQQIAEEGVRRSQWLQEVGWFQDVHQSFAPLVGLLILVTSWFAWSKADPRLRLTAAISVVLVILQVVAGYGLRDLNYPAALQFFHLWFASLLMGVLFTQALLAWRLNLRNS